MAATVCIRLMCGSACGTNAAARVSSRSTPAAAAKTRTCSVLTAEAAPVDPVTTPPCHCRPITCGTLSDRPATRVFLSTRHWPVFALSSRSSSRLDAVPASEIIPIFAPYARHMLDIVQQLLVACWTSCNIPCRNPRRLPQCRPVLFPLSKQSRFLPRSRPLLSEE